MQGEIYSVSDLVGSIKTLLEENYLNVLVEGEISNFSYSSAGHYYFTLSDKMAGVSCAVFKGDAYRNPSLRKLKDGDKIILQGPISVYQKRGTFQVIGKKIFLSGKGDLKAQFELLKRKLQMEGLFDLDHKQSIPKFPKKISLITAINGAALQDMLNVFKRRSLAFNLVIIPAIVQGDQCSRSVVQGIKKAQNISSDVIVVARGGGSIEDLWGFNSEELARAVFDCPIPVISAIGHQVDFTLIDFVSDLRAETPTAAAELLTQEQTQVLLRLQGYYQKMDSLIEAYHSRVFKLLEKLNPVNSMRLIQASFREKSERLFRIKHSFDRDIIDYREKSIMLDDLISRLEHKMINMNGDINNKVEKLSDSLKLLNPNNVLGRGYTYLNYEGQVIEDIKAFDKLSEDSNLEIVFKDGKGKVKK